MKISGGKIVDTFTSLVKPLKWYTLNDDNDDYEDGEFVPLSKCSKYYYVDEFITGLTGITNDILESAPEQKYVIPLFQDFIGENTLVGHNINFDINFLYNAFVIETGIPLVNNFIDTMRLSRKLFSSSERHSLRDTASACDVDYSNSHRAIGDCLITYNCYIKMQSIINDTYHSFDDFRSLFSKHSRIDYKNITPATSDFDTDNPFFGKTVVFTGAMSISRVEAMQKVVNIGGLVGNGITKTTNYLVVGSLDFVKSINGGKSAKIIKAEKMILSGLEISIITESTFLILLENK